MTADPPQLGGQLALMTRHGLVLERRAGEALWVTAPFGAIALFVVPIALGADLPLLQRVGPGMFWVVVLLFGTLVTLRTSIRTTPAQAAALSLAGVETTARLLGVAAASAVLLLAFELVLAPVAVALYDPLLRGWPWLLVVLPAVAVGLGLLGAIAEGLVGSLGSRTVLGALLSLPLSLPLLLGATQAMEAAAFGSTPMPWLVLLVTVDLVLLLCLLVAGRFLEGIA